MSAPRRSAAAFRAALKDRLKAAASGLRRPYNELEREFVLQRFLARVFAAETSPWVLKGGTGLLMRLPGARHSRDLDLLHPTQDLEQAVGELRALGRSEAGDLFSFVVGRLVTMSGGVAGGTVKVEVYLGGIPFGQFPIDLSTELPFVARVERYRPRPVVELPDVDQLPEFRLYPLPDQVADKVCAMYERHGSGAVPSSRYRDLVDLVLITANFELDAGLTAEALTAEVRRRGLAPPTRLHSPGAGWESGYRAEARRSSLAPELRELGAALLAAGACLEPLLAGEITAGIWDPADGRWRPEPPRPIG